MKLLQIVLLMSLLVFASCGRDGINKINELQSGRAGLNGCPAVSRAADTRGCHLRIRSPQNCQIITSFPIEFAWEGDGCATPYTIYLAGESIEQAEQNGNWAWRRVNTTPINARAWAEPIGEDFINQVVSKDGWYHWVVCNAYDNGCSESAAFYIKR